ncbi:hypothetical protein BASA81_003285 [Batrachochytrium salamandrivorans]|nr:hypothetical protein BASA81_003285 [Batrachochytrium salamandrivorans]
MVKVRIVCPCSPSAHLQQQQQHARANRRAPVSSPNTILPGSLAGPGCGKFVSFTMFLFVITTYMVLSLDTLMLMDAETQQQGEMQQLPRRNLAPPPPAHELTRVKLIVLEEDAAIAAPSLSSKPDTTVVVGGEEREEDFASSLRSVGLALQDPPSTAAEPPFMTAFGAGDVDEVEDSDNNEDGNDNSEGGGGLDFAASTLNWKRLHLCKDGSSAELGMNIPHWLARHRKSAIPSDGYTKTPAEARLRHLKSSLQALNKLGDFKQAVSEASRADYSLCRMDLDTEGRVVVWLPKVKGDALVFVRFGADVRNLGVEIPHSMYDHTLAQGLYVFVETRARALVLSTSHRCSRALANACTGNENEPIRNVCASSATAAAGTGTALAAASSNRNSDVAHAVQTMFHSAHEQLAEDFPNLIFASLHSTKAEEFVISDGTSLPQGPDSAVWKLARKLGSSLPLTTVSVCNEGGEHEPENVRRVRPERSFICGATNVQGRHLNGAASDACRAKIPRNGQGLVSSARFLHIEQPVSFVLPFPSVPSTGGGGEPKPVKPVLTKELSDALVFAITAK